MSQPKLHDSESSRAFKRREPKPYWEKKWLVAEYVKKGRSAQEIAAEFGCAETNVLYFLTKNGIPRRSMKEVRQVKTWAMSGAANGMYGKCGAQNPRWIDGSAPERQTMYARSFWKELAKVVLERDSYKCQRCNATHSGKNKLHAHHIKTWAGNPKSRFLLPNIIILCQTCHNWVHSKANVNNEYLSS
jgi:transposase-like protein